MGDQYKQTADAELSRQALNVTRFPRADMSPAMEQDDRA